MMHNDLDVQWHSRVPPGVPGAGWLIAIIFVFSVVVFGDWWWQGSSRISVAAPAATHHSIGNHN